jgi:hypothetical protein
MDKLRLFDIEIANNLHMNGKVLALWQMPQQINEGEAGEKFII